MIKASAVSFKPYRFNIGRTASPILKTPNDGGLIFRSNVGSDTWQSPALFAARTQRMNNPLIQPDKHALPLFDKVEAKHVVPAITHALDKLDATVKAILARLDSGKEATWKSVITPLEDAEQTVHRIFEIPSYIVNIASTPEFDKALEEAIQIRSVRIVAIAQNKAMYNAFKQIKSNFANELTEAEIRALDARIIQAERSGLALSVEGRRRVSEILSDLSGLSMKMGKNVRESDGKYQHVVTNKEHVAGLPKNILEAASARYNSKAEAEGAAVGDALNGPWSFGIDQPVYQAIMSQAEYRPLREKYSIDFNLRATEDPFNNQPVFKRILELRLEYARLLGFNNYAELSVADKAAPSLQAVYELEELLATPAREYANKEAEALQKFAEAKGFTEKLEAWDIGFYLRQMNEELVGIDSEAIREYFPLPKVLDGMFRLAEQIFDVTVKRPENKPPVPHPDVDFFDIYDSDGEKIASFYMDLHSRPGTKRNGAWMNDFLIRYRDSKGELHLPVGTLNANFRSPAAGQVAQLSPDEVETLFHEFGHNLQHLLGRVDIASVSGLQNIEFDTVEVASQFMETWLSTPEVLRNISEHITTKAQLPDELIAKLKLRNTFMAGRAMLGQIAYGMADLALHDGYDPTTNSETPSELFRRVANNYLPTELPEGADRLAAFTHLSSSYGAGYFSYKWAEVMAIDLFTKFEPHLNDSEKIREIGKLLRETIYGMGGGRDPMKVFEDFMGRKPDAESLLKFVGLA